MVKVNPKDLPCSYHFAGVGLFKQMLEEESHDCSHLYCLGNQTQTDGHSRMSGYREKKTVIIRLIRYREQSGGLMRSCSTIESTVVALPTEAWLFAERLW